MPGSCSLSSSHFSKEDGTGKFWPPGTLKNPGEASTSPQSWPVPRLPSAGRPNSWPSQSGWEEHLFILPGQLGRGQCTRLESGMCLIAEGEAEWINTL